MRIVLLQSSNQGFFPAFYANLKRAVECDGGEIAAFLPRSGVNLRNCSAGQVIWGSRFNWTVHFSLYRLTGLQDIWSFFSTLNLLRKLSKYRPDILHLNVINDCNLCFPLLLFYINRKSLKVVWTLHDCRPVTARCANFDQDSCGQWMCGCRQCTANSIYFKSLLNNVALQWRMKRKWYRRFHDLTIVTPSQWMAGIVERSILGGQRVQVINNGIDVSLFACRSGIVIPELEGWEGKTVLGVSFVWEPRKGLETVKWLSSELPEDYRIVIVGNVAPDYVNTIPPSVTLLPATSDINRLAAIYQYADVFINPTLADNFPTVNIEALAAGVPVVTFRTGGSAECLDDCSGISVDTGDDESFMNAVIEVCSHTEKYTREKCLARSRRFSAEQFRMYVELYHKMIEV